MLQKLKIFVKLLCYSVALEGCVLFSSPAFAVDQAQSFSPAQIAAARAAVAALHATDQFDEFLPVAARDLKMQFMTRDPNLSDMISKIVDKEALAIANKRSELEEQVAYVYAKDFTQEELQQITQFYTSPVGKAFLTKGPKALQDTFVVFQDWSKKITDDLAQKITADLEAYKQNASKGAK